MNTVFINSKTVFFFFFFIININHCFAFGTFLENFIDYTTIHLVREWQHPHIVSTYWNKDSPHQANGANRLDPLHFQKNVSIADSTLRLDLSCNGFLKGLTNYNIEKISVTPDLSATFIGTLKDTQISGSYKINGSYYTVLPMVGDGVYLILLKNVSISIGTKILPSGGHVQLLSFEADYSYDDLQISLWGLTGDAAVANILQEFLKDFISIALKKEKTMVTKFLNNIILTEGNSKLKNVTISTVIELIKDLFIY